VPASHRIKLVFGNATKLVVFPEIRGNFVCPASNGLPSTMKSILITAIASLAILASTTSCRKKGPAEKAGEKMDETIENVKDAVDPKGPVEKAGEKVDEALGK
jgi:predicted small lipoprotein YifL